MNNYCMIQNSKTFAFSAENPTGVRAGGSQGGDCTKLRPTVTIPAGETVTLVDAAGPGVIQHMWFTGYVGHHFIIRMYWDDQEYHKSKMRLFSKPAPEETSDSHISPLSTVHMLPESIL